MLCVFHLLLELVFILYLTFVCVARLDSVLILHDFCLKALLLELCLQGLTRNWSEGAI